MVIGAITTIMPRVDIQATCEEEAKATNDSRKDKPPTSEIFA